MNEQERWERILATVIEKGDRRIRQKKAVLFSSLLSVVLLVAVALTHFHEQQFMAKNEVYNRGDVETALLEESIIVDDIGILY